MAVFPAVFRAGELHLLPHHPEQPRPGPALLGRGIFRHRRAGGASAGGAPCGEMDEASPGPSAGRGGLRRSSGADAPVPDGARHRPGVGPAHQRGVGLSWGQRRHGRHGSPGLPVSGRDGRGAVRHPDGMDVPPGLGASLRRPVSDLADAAGLRAGDSGKSAQRRSHGGAFRAHPAGSVSAGGAGRAARLLKTACEKGRHEKKPPAAAVAFRPAPGGRGRSDGVPRGPRFPEAALLQRDDSVHGAAGGHDPHLPPPCRGAQKSLIPAVGAVLAAALAGVQA